MAYWTITSVIIRVFIYRCSDHSVSIHADLCYHEIKHQQSTTMSQNKTQPTEQSVIQFLTAVTPDQKRQDAFALLEMMERLSGYQAQMWGPSIIGFGQYHYKYDSGREGDFMRIGFSPRKTNLSLYIIAGVDKHQDLLAELGKHKTGKSCLYVNKLSDVRLNVLEQLIVKALEYMAEKYPEDA